VREQAADLKNPPLSVADVLDTLAQHVPTTVRWLRTAFAAWGEPSMTSHMPTTGSRSAYSSRLEVRPVLASAKALRCDAPLR
jgi:hypothetical protein